MGTVLVLRRLPAGRQGLFTVANVNTLPSCRTAIRHLKCPLKLTQLNNPHPVSKSNAMGTVLILRRLLADRQGLFTARLAEDKHQRVEAGGYKKTHGGY